jgi:hypothetical protein
MTCPPVAHYRILYFRFVWRHEQGLSLQVLLLSRSMPWLPEVEPAEFEIQLHLAQLAQLAFGLQIAYIEGAFKSVWYLRGDQFGHLHTRRPHSSLTKANSSEVRTLIAEPDATRSSTARPSYCASSKAFGGKSDS